MDAPWGVCAAERQYRDRQASLAELREGAQGILDDARTRANDVRELSAAELQALWAIEYTSLEVAHADLGDVDERLNAMGRERWECYHVSEHEQGRVFYFKRRTSNAVAYLTNRGSARSRSSVCSVNDACRWASTARFRGREPRRDVSCLHDQLPDVGDGARGDARALRRLHGPGG